MTLWLEENSSDAKRIVDMIRDMYVNVPYQTRLYLFFLANNVLVRERSTGVFSYTPLFADLLPYMVEKSLEKIEYPEIASRILGVIRLWNDKHTMGRSMTARVLSSIPSQVFLQFPQFNDINIHAQEPEPAYESISAVAPVERNDAAKENLSVELQRFLSHFESFKSTSPLRRQIEAKRNLLEKIRDFDPSEYGSDCEEYEVCINVKEVMSLCNEEKSSCYRELDALQRLEELVNHAIETQDNELQENKKLIEKCGIYINAITHNNELLFQSSKKRE
ncbi:hypothetical protein JH06_3846 [Blastocystis sp. subtype 4]|uniref:hypothetical protein n=1 Tax=Blastocystis sp. subtype 4 TaxID=944170 RepID=UPI000711D932|nr:hypothetical protein JH06_3846 [Blastocystis sp. subtype 4]KNB42927.1 hypothetical protein JH06_3846 [Blastocystis sp. subtype 4]|eukprot:XP_014526370.1 hypothetical protein JH06_3846 [Blastocystis sp. subtype 4]